MITEQDHEAELQFTIQTTMQRGISVHSCVRGLLDSRRWLGAGEGNFGEFRIYVKGLIGFLDFSAHHHHMDYTNWKKKEEGRKRYKECWKYKKALCPHL
jgi:hypothetical protein